MTNLRTDMDHNIKRKRRDAVRVVTEHLTAIRKAEQCYLDRVPDNFQNSESFEVGECALDILDEIIDLLADVY